MKKFYALSIFVLMALSGCGSQYSAEKLYWQANQAAKTIINGRPLDKLNAQDYKKIIAGYRRLAEEYPLEPLSAQSQFIIAQIYILQNQLPKAEEELVKVTQNFSQNSEIASLAQFRIGALYEQQGDWTQARREYENVIDLFPLSSMGLKTPLYIAEYYQRGKDGVKADNAYHKAIKHYQKFINEYSGTTVSAMLKDYLALAYASQGKWNEAVDIWQTLVDEYPQSQIGETLLFAIGETYSRQIKDLQKAIDTYDDFVKKNPASKIIRYAKFQIGRLYLIKEDFAKARQLFEELIRDYPAEGELRASSQLAIAVSYERQGSADKAMEIYHKLRNSFADNMPALGVPLLIAQHYLKENRAPEAENAFKEAITGYEKIIKDKPNTARAEGARNFLSLAYINQKKWDKAIDSLKASADAHPNDPRTAKALFTIAAIYRGQLGEPGKAIEIYEKFIQQYPGHALASMAKSEIDSLQKSKN